jgi:hypothetical protein
MGIDLFFIPRAGVRTENIKIIITAENSIPNVFLCDEILIIITL